MQAAAPGSNPAPLPTRAVRLREGDTLISDQFNDRVLEVTPAGQVVFQQGAINMPGNGFNQLNVPYDAKVIGDFTGLTPPFGLGTGVDPLSFARSCLTALRGGNLKRPRFSESCRNEVVDDGVLPYSTDTSK